MKLTRILFLPLFFVLFLGLFVKFPLVGAVARKDFVSLSIAIHGDDGFDELATRLATLDFHNFTFVIAGWPDWGVWDEVMNNSTRIDILKTYGVLIPRYDYLQQYSLAIRSGMIDTLFETINTKCGYYPKGFFSFVPDTFMAQYAKEEYNATYVQGYCFDQYLIDFMSMRGGWQLPYYSSASHVLKPSDSEGVVVFPHTTWDWLDGFTASCYLNCHIQNLMTYFGDNEAVAKAYWLELIDRSVTGCSPFGYVGVQWEWDWMVSEGLSAYCFEWFDTLLENPLYTFWTYQDVAGWFLTNYASNPVYRVSVASPISESSVEWYWSSLKRVCRVGGVVLSYVDYAVPCGDKYRTETQTISWGAGWIDNPSNCIDISLYPCLAVDALGGGEWRFGGVGEGVAYSGDLADFGGVGATVFWYQDPVLFGCYGIALFAVACILIKVWKG